MKSDERSRVKHSYTTNSIWMLGIEYSFTGKIILYEFFCFNNFHYFVYIYINIGQDNSVKYILYIYKYGRMTSRGW